MAETGQQICLKFLQQGTKKDFIQQGYEYLLTLATDIGEEYNIRLEENCGYDDLLELTKQMIPYFMENNAEPDAIDLAMKIDTPEILIQVSPPHILFQRPSDNLLAPQLTALPPRFPPPTASTRTG